MSDNKELNMRAVSIADEYDISEKMKIRLEMDIVKLAWEYANGIAQSQLQELRETIWGELNALGVTRKGVDDGIKYTLDAEVKIRLHFIDLIGLLEN